MARPPIVDGDFLRKLERLALHWQKSVPGRVGGRVPSRFAGPGQEFLDHRHFHHGDDLRAVNWRAYMRLDKLFLKMFQVEPRIPVRLLLDVSQSMSNKFDYARRLAAALSYIGLVRLDTISIHPFRDELYDPCVCSGGRHRFMPVASFLSDLEHSGKTDYLAVARQFASTCTQRGLLLIISDFLDDADVDRPLQYLSDFGHELSLIQVWAPEDREPEVEGELDLVDAETGAHMELALDQPARLRYRQAFDAYSQKLQMIANRGGGSYIGLSSNTILEEALFDSMMRAGTVQ